MAYLTSPTTTISTNYVRQQIIINHISSLDQINDADAIRNDNIELLQMKQSLLERNNINYADTSTNVELLQMKQSLIGRAYRRGKKLLTREKEDTTTIKHRKKNQNNYGVLCFIIRNICLIVLHEN